MSTMLWFAKAHLPKHWNKTHAPSGLKTPRNHLRLSVLYKVKKCHGCQAPNVLGPSARPKHRPPKIARNSRGLIGLANALGLADGSPPAQPPEMVLQTLASLYLIMVLSSRFSRTSHPVSHQADGSVTDQRGTELMAVVPHANVPHLRRCLQDFRKPRILTWSGNAIVAIFWI